MHIHANVMAFQSVLFASVTGTLTAYVALSVAF